MRPLDAAGVASVAAALVEAAVSGTGAAGGWLLEAGPTQLELVAEFGGGTGSAPGLGLAAPLGAGSAGFVVGSGQPVARRLRPGDTSEAGSVLAQRQPGTTSLLCVPCLGDDEVLGVLELFDRQGSAGFTIDDIELASVLAGIAASLLAGQGVATSGAGGGVAAAADLAPFARLASERPAELAALAQLAQALLAGNDRR